MHDRQAILDHITRTIVERFSPRRIVLFGSQARENAGEDSDYDIFVEMETELRPWERGAQVSLALFPRSFPLDVVVYTPAEVARLRRRVGSLLRAIEAEGSVLYERH